MFSLVLGFLRFSFIATIEHCCLWLDYGNLSYHSFNLIFLTCGNPFLSISDEL